MYNLGAYDQAYANAREKYFLRQKSGAAWRVNVKRTGQGSTTAQQATRYQAEE